jgi:hypothetical protein
MSLSPHGHVPMLTDSDDEVPISWFTYRLTPHGLPNLLARGDSDDEIRSLRDCASHLSSSISPPHVWKDILNPLVCCPPCALVCVTAGH